MVGMDALVDGLEQRVRNFVRQTLKREPALHLDMTNGLGAIYGDDLHDLLESSVVSSMSR
jgi:hypothetical protein